MTKLLAKLPASNGLDAINDTLCKEPLTRHLVLALVDTARITTDIDTGDNEATARILRVERLAADDAKQGHQLLRRGFEARTGQTTLPLEMEDEIDALFDGFTVDPVTGELRPTDPEQGDAK